MSAYVEDPIRPCRASNKPVSQWSAIQKTCDGASLWAVSWTQMEMKSSLNRPAFVDQSARCGQTGSDFLKFGLLQSAGLRTTPQP